MPEISLPTKTMQDAIKTKTDLIGSANPTAGNATTVMNYIKRIDDKLSNSGGNTEYGSRLFTSGTTTFTVPTGVTRLFISGAGGGGGGGGGSSYNTSSAGGGGGGGAFCCRLPVVVTPGEVITLTVGTGGSGGAPGSSGVAGGNGGNGTPTSFGNRITLGNGTAGGGASGNNGGSAGVSGNLTYAPMGGNPISINSVGDVVIANENICAVKRTGTSAGSYYNSTGGSLPTPLCDEMAALILIKAQLPTVKSLGNGGSCTGGSGNGGTSGIGGFLFIEWGLE